MQVEEKSSGIEICSLKVSLGLFQAPYQHPHVIWPLPLREQNTSKKEVSKGSAEKNKHVAGMALA